MFDPCLLIYVWHMVSWHVLACLVSDNASSGALPCFCHVCSNISDRRCAAMFLSCLLKHFWQVVYWHVLACWLSENAQVVNWHVCGLLLQTLVTGAIMSSGQDTTRSHKIPENKYGGFACFEMPWWGSLEVKMKLCSTCIIGKTLDDWRGITLPHPQRVIHQSPAQMTWSQASESPKTIPLTAKSEAVESPSTWCWLWLSFSLSNSRHGKAIAGNQSFDTGANSSKEIGFWRTFWRQRVVHGGRSNVAHPDFSMCSVSHNIVAAVCSFDP